MYLAEEWEYVDDNLSIFEGSSGHHTLALCSGRHGLHDPVHEVGGLGVDPGEVRPGAPQPPAHDTHALAPAHEGAAAVALPQVTNIDIRISTKDICIDKHLAGVLATLGQPGTDHGVLDVVVAVALVGPGHGAG